MQRNASTLYPILLVHGLFGFDRIGPFELFQDIKQALRRRRQGVHTSPVGDPHQRSTR